LPRIKKKVIESKSNPYLGTNYIIYINQNTKLRQDFYLYPSLRSSLVIFGHVKDKEVYFVLQG